MNPQKPGISSHSFRSLTLRVFALTLLFHLTACIVVPPATPAVTQVSPDSAISPTVPPPSPTAETRWSEQTRLSRGGILFPPRFSPDGTRFAVPTSNGITVFDTHGWSEVLELSNEDMDRRVPSALAFSPDGKRLAAAYGSSIRFWQETGGEPPDTVDLGSDAYYITNLEFSPDGASLAAGYWEGTTPHAVVLQVSDWQPAYTVEGLQPRFSSDGQRLATVTAMLGENPFVSLYTAAQGQLIHRWGGQSVAFLPADELLIEADGATRVVETQAGTFAARLALNGSAPALSADGRQVAAFEPGRIRVYDMAEGVLLRTLELPQADPPLEVESLLFSPDGQHLAASTSTRPCDSCEPRPGPTFLWQLADGGGVYELPAPGAPAWLSFDPDGKELVVATSDAIRRYDPASGVLTGSVSTFSDSISELALSPDGKLLAVGYGETGQFGLRVWDLETLSEPRVYRSVAEEIAALDWWKMAFSPDGKLVGLGGHFWDVETGVPLTLPFPGMNEAATAISLAFAPYGHTVALGLPGGEVHVCDLDTYTCNQTLVADSPGDVISLAPAPDGAQLAAAYAYTFEAYPSPAAQVWQMPAGVPLYPLPAANIVYVAYAPDGQLLATLTIRAETYQRNFPYGVIQLWSNTGEQRTTLPPTNVMRLAFSPDGQVLAAGLGDGRVQLWNLDGALVQELDTSQSGVIAGLAFTPDGGRLIIASATGVIEVWGR